jgi:uncharacterized protein with PIN domain
MTSPSFKKCDTGIVIEHTVGSNCTEKIECTPSVVLLKSIRDSQTSGKLLDEFVFIAFTPSGVRVEGTRLWELMIDDIVVGSTQLITTAVSLNIVHEFKEFIDPKVKDVRLCVGDTFRYHLRSTSSQRLLYRLFIDGVWS